MVRRYDRLAQAHHDLQTGTVTTTAQQQATVRALIADQPDADLLAAILGLDDPVYQPVPPREHPRHYHRPDMPRATRIGGWV